MSNSLKNLLAILLIATGYFFPLFSESEESTNKQDPLPSSENRFVIAIASYNNKEWYKQNLDSVFEQNYKNYRIIYVDDCSPDGTGQVVADYIKEKKQESVVTLIRNENRVGSLSNLYKAIHLCDPDEIIVTLDGDDWLNGPTVLDRLNKEYSDPDVWVTYGQFKYNAGWNGWAKQLPQDIIDGNKVREYPWVTTALRTFYAGLFQKINKEDFYHEGKMLTITGDLALMFPIIEMAGKHSRFIPDVLYIYNLTAINDTATQKETQFNLGLMLRKKRRYAPLANRSDLPQYEAEKKEVVPETSKEKEAA